MAFARAYVGDDGVARKARAASAADRSGNDGCCQFAFQENAGRPAHSSRHRTGVSKDMKPIGRRGCIGYCAEEDMYFWEKTGRCIPKNEAKIACEENRGTWIVTVDTKEERCRIPLAEIDPQATNRLNQFKR
jgi:hypothetical protein